MLNLKNFYTGKRFSIKMAYVPFSDKKTVGKYRPVVILHKGHSMSRIMNITSRYHYKDDWIKKYLVIIKVWKQIGLAKPSYVDTLNTKLIPNDCFVPSSVTKTYSPLDAYESAKILYVNYKCKKDIDRFDHKYHIGKYSRRHVSQLTPVDSNAKILVEFD